MVCAGIDTGKRKLDVALEGSVRELQVDNSPHGHSVLSAWLREHRVKRIGIEASGGYEQAVVSQLRHDGFVVIVFQPAQVRAYAMFHLQRAKNDKIDAGLIAACTAAAHEDPCPARSSPGAICRASDADRADHRGHCPVSRPRSRPVGIQRLRGLWREEIARLKAVLRVELKQLVAAHPPAPLISPSGSI